MLLSVLETGDFLSSLCQSVTPAKQEVPVIRVFFCLNQLCWSCRAGESQTEPDLPGTLIWSLNAPSVLLYLLWHRAARIPESC